MSVVGEIGARLDLLIRQGATLAERYVDVAKVNGEEVNLQNSTIRAQIRKNRTTAPRLDGVDFNFRLDAVKLNRFYFSLPASSSNRLQAGESVDDDDSRYVWDLEVELENGRVIPLFYGEVEVAAEATKDD